MDFRPTGGGVCAVQLGVKGSGELAISVTWLSERTGREEMGKAERGHLILTMVRRGALGAGLVDPVKEVRVGLQPGGGRR